MQRIKKFKSDYKVKHLLKIYLVFLGNECDRFPTGWSAHTIGATRKCLFAPKVKVEINHLETFCHRLNASVPYLKTKEENLNYLNAFKTRNITASVAIMSHYGIAELKRDGFWNPFSTKTSLNVVCEKAATGRIKRQASSGNYFFYWTC